MFPSRTPFHVQVRLAHLRGGAIRGGHGHPTLARRNGQEGRYRRSAPTARPFAFAGGSMADRSQSTSYASC